MAGVNANVPYIPSLVIIGTRDDGTHEVFATCGITCRSDHVDYTLALQSANTKRR